MSATTGLASRTVNVTDSTSAPSMLARLTPVRRADPLRSFLFSVTALIAVHPIKTIFATSASRDQLVSSTTWAIGLIIGLGLLLRVVRIPWWLHPFASFAALGALGFRLIHHDEHYIAQTANSRALGRPASSWIQFGVDAIRQAVTAIHTSTRPTVALLGFSILSVVLVGLLTMISHIFAFDLDAPFEALLPLVAILVMGTALGPGRGADTEAKHWSLAFVVAAGAYLIYDGARRRRNKHRWVGTGRPAWWRIGVLFTLFAAASLTAGLFAFGAIGNRFVRVETGGVSLSRPGRTRTVASPVVSIRPRLLELSDSLMFTVQSRDAEGKAVPSYWRQSALDRFDGSSWSLRSRSFTGIRSGDSLDSDGVTTSSGQAVTGHVRIAGLTDAWLPAAYRVVRVAQVPRGHTATAEPTSGNLLLDGDTTPGLQYDVESVLPPLTEPYPSSLAPPADVIAQAIELPSGVDPVVKTLAEKIIATAGATGADDFTKATVLQDFFRTNFTYTTDVTWHGSDPLVTFLRERRGYCEQFSSAFAVMARLLGIPTRVAVGFTAGELQSDGLFHVTGKNAHAWPEVLLAGNGWVPFEPTPGRTRPSGTPVAVPVSDQLDSAPTVPAATIPATAGPTIAILDPALSKKSHSSIPGLLRLLALLLLIVTATAAIVFGLPAFVLRSRIARQRRHLQFGLPPAAARLEWSWHELLVTVRAVAREPIVTSPTVTPNEIARIVEARLGVHRADALRSVAATLTAARFAPDSADFGPGQAGPQTGALDAASADAQSLEMELRRELEGSDAVRRWAGLPSAKFR